MNEGVLLAVLALTLWGVSDYFASLSSKKINPEKTFLWMQIVGLIPLTIIAFIIGFPVFSGKTIALIMLIGALIMVATSSYYRALEIGKVSILSPISSTWPVITVALSIIFLNETLNSIQVMGIVLTIVGTILVSFKYHELIKLKVKKFSKGVNIVLISILCWGLAFTLVPFAVREVGWYFPIFLAKATTILLMMPYMFWKKHEIKFSGAKNWIAVTIVGIFAGSAFLAYGYALNNAYNSLIAPIAASSPAVTILLAHIFSKERLELNQYIGIVLVLGGIVLLSL